VSLEEALLDGKVRQGLAECRRRGLARVRTTQILIVSYNAANGMVGLTSSICTSLPNTDTDACSTSTAAGDSTRKLASRVRRVLAVALTCTALCWDAVAGWAVARAFQPALTTALRDWLAVLMSATTSLRVGAGAAVTALATGLGLVAAVFFAAGRGLILVRVVSGRVDIARDDRGAGFRTHARIGDRRAELQVKAESRGTCSRIKPPSRVAATERGLDGCKTTFNASLIRH